MMRLLYISYDPLPTEKAHGVNIIKTCEALAMKGVALTLILPRTRHGITHDLFPFYGITRMFDVLYIPSIDGVRLRLPYGFWVRRFSFAVALASFLCIRSRKGIVILTRDEVSAIFLYTLGYKVCYDMHGFPESKRWFWRFVMRRMRGIFVTNAWKVERCEKVFGIPRKRITVIPNGYDPAFFKEEVAKGALKKELGFPEGLPVVLYAGNFYDWKGAHILLDVARKYTVVKTQGKQVMPFFVFVGGAWDQALRFRHLADGIKNVAVLGYRPYFEISKYLMAADVLVLPNSQHSREERFAIYSRYDTSPIKLFEYMASGTPVVASALPSIREILNSGNAELVEPDNPLALYRGIEQTLSNPARSARRAKQAMEDAREYTWEKRGERILSFMKTRV